MPDLSAVAQRYQCISRIALLLVAMTAPGVAAAMGLGAAQVRSGLGRPLNVMIPVLSDDAGELTDNCFALTQPGHADDSLPSLKNARLTVKNMAGIPYLALTTQYAVNDPVLVFAIETRCSGQVRREYTLLLDVASNASNAAVVASPAIVPPATAKPRAAQPAPKTGAELFSSKQGFAVKRKLPDPGRHSAAVNLHLSTSLSSLPGQTRCRRNS